MNVTNQAKKYTPEQVIATTFALSPEQRRLCDVSFLLHCPAVDFVALKETCLNNKLQFFVWSSPGMENKDKLVAAIHFPSTPAAELVEASGAKATTLISVRTYKSVSYALFVPALEFVAKGGVTTVHPDLPTLVQNCMLSMAELQTAIDMGVL